MSDQERDLDSDPGDTEPTDNSAGAPVDLDRVQALEQDRSEAPDQ